MKIKARWNIKYDGEIFLAGASFEADDDTAAALIGSGAAVVADDQAEPAADGEQAPKPKAKKAKA